MRTMQDSGYSWLGKIPSNWALIRLRYAVKLRSEKGIYQPGNLYIGLENIEGFTGKHTPTESEYDEGIYDVFMKGDVLFSKLRPYLGKAMIAEDNGFCTGELSIIKESIGDKRFLLHYLLSDGFLKMVDASTYGAKMPRANWDFIQDMVIPHIQAEQQADIARFLDAKCSQIDSLISDIKSQIALLEEYKRSVITEAVTKGLDPNVPMKDSGVEWIGMVPEHWDTKRLGYLFNQVKSKNEGLVEEVKELHRKGVSWKRLISFGLEYKFISLFFL